MQIMRPLSLYGARLAPLVATLMLCGVWQVAAVSLTDSPKVTCSASSATITWKTDVASGTRFFYGTAAGDLKEKIDGPVDSTHTVTVQGLQSGTTYYYAVGSARTKLATGSFTTGGTARSTGGPLPPVVEKNTAPNTAKKATPAVAVKPPPTRSTWASLDSLPDHFARHGRDFNATSADDYAAQAWTFLQRGRREGLPMKWDESDSTLRVWDPSKRIFAAYTRNGKTRTFFKPGNPDYWGRQPGRLVKPSELPF